MVHAAIYQTYWQEIQSRVINLVHDFIMNNTNLEPTDSTITVLFPKTDSPDTVRHLDQSAYVM